MYTFKIAKTDLHSGRLMFAYTPTPSPGASPTLEETSYVNRSIIDIREGNEVCICLPWLLNMDYLDTDTPMGRLDVIVVNKLRRPESASNSIGINTWISAGEDFEYAVPSGQDSLLVPVFPQSGEHGGSVNLLEGGVGCTTEQKLDVEHAEMAIGEHFTSIRQLLLRESRLFDNGGIPADTTVTYSPRIVFTADVASDSTLTGPLTGGDNYSYLAPMYTFNRGSMRLMFCAASFSEWSGTLDPYPPVDGQFARVGGPRHGSVGSENWLTTPYGPGATALTEASDAYGAFSIPYYNDFRLSLNAYKDTPTFAEMDQSVPEIGITIATPTVTQDTVRVYRSIGEDHQLLCYVGCPPLAFKQLA